MGLNASYLGFIESWIEQVLGCDFSGLRMLELGDQVIRDLDIVEDTGKDYFTNRGFEHVSVDINGLHGSIVRDLTKPEEFKDWHGSYDVLTNAGTTEHVEPFESQYDCFGIIHDCVRVGGIMIHVLPDVYERDEHGLWINHCRYYFSKPFFELLAKECKYELLATTTINGHLCVALRKTKDVPFMDDITTLLSAIAQRDYQTTIKRRLLKLIGAEKLVEWGGIENVLKKIRPGMV